MKKSHIVLLSACAAFLCVVLGIFVSRSLFPLYFVKTNVPDSVAQSFDSDGKININTATAEDLMLLPGIGELTAQKIIDYRETNGPFTSIANLTEVDGIGEGTLNKIRDYITTGG